VTDRLKAWLDEQDRTLPSESRDWYKANRALRAVVELHKEIGEHPIARYDNYCISCHLPMPCPTIRAIEKEVFGAE
jgi:hypothetical protein